MKINPLCKACGGTGRNSRGNLCGPCQARGRPVEPVKEMVEESVGPDSHGDAAIPPAPTVDPALEGFL